MPMRLLLFLAALAMPVVAWQSQRGAFGPTTGEVADRFPTLLSAAGWAFSVWSLIFLLDLVFAVWQWRPRQSDDATLAAVRPAATLGFVLTAAWMPAFSQQMFDLALAMIWAALGCVLACAIVLARDDAPRPGARAWAWLPLSLHAGWLSLAAFLNTAQVAVAYDWLPAADMLGWSLWLVAALAALLLLANAAMRGNGAYALVAVWGLVAVWRGQLAADLPGSETVATVAVALALVLALQTLLLIRRGRRLRDRRRGPR